MFQDFSEKYLNQVKCIYIDPLFTTSQQPLRIIQSEVGILFSQLPYSRNQTIIISDMPDFLLLMFIKPYISGCFLWLPESSDNRNYSKNQDDNTHDREQRRWLR